MNETMDYDLDLIPAGNRVVIKPFVVEKSKGGIIIPDGAINLSEGRIIATGPSVRTFKVGDLILYGKNSGALIDRNRKEFVLLYEKDIECQIDESKSGKDNLVKKEAQ